MKRFETIVLCFRTKIRVRNVVKILVMYGLLTTVHCFNRMSVTIHILASRLWEAFNPAPLCYT